MEKIGVPGGGGTGNNVVTFWKLMSNEDSKAFVSWRSDLLAAEDRTLGLNPTELLQHPEGRELQEPHGHVPHGDLLDHLGTHHQNSGVTYLSYQGKL